MEECTERLGEVVERQVVVPRWLQEMLEQVGPEGMVRTRTRVTPFGSFLMGVEVVR